MRAGGDGLRLEQVLEDCEGEDWVACVWMRLVGVRCKVSDGREQREIETETYRAR